METTRALRDVSRSGAKRLLQADHRNAQCRGQSEEKAAEEGDRECKQQDMPIQTDLFGTRQIAWPEEDKRANANGSEQDAKRASGNAQYRTFREALTYQTTLAR